MSTTTADREDSVVSTSAILELFAGAVRAATPGVVPAELRILRGAELHGCTDECCARLLADFGPLVAHLPVVDRELHGAAVCIAAAMRHLQRGEDSGPALDAAQAHLNAALDAHPVVASMTLDLPRSKRPCRECPWRKDVEPGQFPACRYDALRNTSGSAGREAHLGAPMFACHKSPEGQEWACAGWLAAVGYEHLGVRFLVITERIPVEAMSPGEDWPELHGSYEEMVAAKAGGLR